MRSPQNTLRWPKGKTAGVSDRMDFELCLSVGWGWNYCWKNREALEEACTLVQGWGYSQLGLCLLVLLFWASVCIGLGVGSWGYRFTLELPVMVES